MTIRLAHEADALAMGHVMVDTFLAGHRDQMPAEAWAKRIQEWTYAVSAQGWERTLHNIAAGQQVHECIYIAEEHGQIVGLAMGGATDVPQTGAVQALYIWPTHQRRGLGRQLLLAVAADLAQHGSTALEIGCLAVNTPARHFYERMGGRLIDQRLFDEDDILLPEVVYGWPDITTLIATR